MVLFQFLCVHLQDMQGLMDTMMRQLLSKEVLYEPMKEIGDRYPGWLESHKSELSSEDTARYTRQYDFIKQLCHVYETTPDDFSKVVDLMQNMQDCGQPPPDIVRELAPGLELGEDGLPTYVFYSYIFLQLLFFVKFDIFCRSITKSL